MYEQRGPISWPKSATYARDGEALLAHQATSLELVRDKHYSDCAGTPEPWKCQLRVVPTQTPSQNTTGHSYEGSFSFTLLRLIGRGERIRTSDLSVPNRAHYQAVLRPDERRVVKTFVY